MDRFLDYNGNEVILSLGTQEFPAEPKHVWVVASYQGQWLLTQHKIRGLEFPGGKAEKGETLEEAASRELFEETGATASQLTRIGTYMVKQGKPFAKAIFFAQVDSLKEKQDYLETDGPLLWREDFKGVKVDERFSFVMKDKVLEKTLNFLKDNHYLQK